MANAMLLNNDISNNLNDNIEEKAIQYLVKRCSDLDIDWSHGVEHGIDVMEYSKSIMINYNLNTEERHTILLSSLLHDTCDDKYCDDIEDAVYQTIEYLKTLYLNDNIINNIIFIINNISYSKVKKYGYPNFNNNNKLELCFHIVRVSDLLAGYNPERSIIYNYIKKQNTFTQSIINMKSLFDIRVFTYISDGLFDPIPCSLSMANELSNHAYNYMLLSTNEMKLQLMNKGIISNDEL
jgi:hypothetical protein